MTQGHVAAVAYTTAAALMMLLLPLLLLVTPPVDAVFSDACRPGGLYCEAGGALSSQAGRFASRWLSVKGPCSVWRSAASWRSAATSAFDPQSLKADIKTSLEVDIVRGLVGQEHVTHEIVNAVLFKVQNPDTPCILHFAGDHGVGKTKAAKAVSRALSLHSTTRYKFTMPDAGDALLLISGTAYEGMPADQLRQYLVKSIVDHIKVHPFGVVLIDEADKLPLDAVRVLTPLIKSVEYPEHPGVSLSRAVVILTSDFGEQGRTRGKSSEQVRAEVVAAMATAWPGVSLLDVRTFPFLPFSKQSALQLAEVLVRGTTCRDRRVQRVQFLETLPASIVQALDASRDIEMRNGRAIVQFVESIVDNRLATYFASAGSDVTVEDTIKVDPVTGKFRLNVKPTTMTKDAVGALANVEL